MLIHPPTPPPESCLTNVTPCLPQPDCRVPISQGGDSVNLLITLNTYCLPFHMGKQLGHVHHENCVWTHGSMSNPTCSSCRQAVLQNSRERSSLFEGVGKTLVSTAAGGSTGSLQPQREGKRGACITWVHSPAPGNADVPLAMGNSQMGWEQACPSWSQVQEKPSACPGG